MRTLAKLISAAVIYHDDKGFLICRNTVVNGAGDWKYDLPKGLVEEGEDHNEAAIREFLEEVGIELDKNNLIYEGIHPYNDVKVLSIFTYYCKSVEKDIGNFKCSSMIEKNGIYITDRKGNKIPEIDSYKYIEFQKMRLFMRQRMVNAISAIIERFVSSENRQRSTKISAKALYCNKRRRA